MRSFPLSVLSALALAGFGLMALGSNSSDTKPSSGAAAPAGSGTAAAAAGGGKEAVLATCTVKYNGALGKCSENYGAIPGMAEELCKGDEGVFVKGSTPCPMEKASGKCDYKAASPGAPGEAHYFYPASVGDPKGSCEALGAAWTTFSAAPAATAAPTPKKK